MAAQSKTEEEEQTIIGLGALHAEKDKALTQGAHRKTPKS